MISCLVPVLLEFEIAKMLQKKLKNVYQFASLIIKKPFLLSRKEYVFILSHMRSRSTLLSHILGSHNEISGYSESHRSYFTKRDLTRLNYYVYSMNGHKISGRYVLDKLLIDQSIAEKILENKNLSLIFMLRQPNETFSSILKMGKILKNNSEFEADICSNYLDLDWIENYYINRLNTIKNYASIFCGNMMYIDSDSIVNKTDETLDLLTHFLKLDSSLSSNYQVFEKTGQPRFGDMSEFISSGNIIKNSDQKFSLDYEINTQKLKKAQLTYLECREYLINKSNISI